MIISEFIDYIIKFNNIVEILNDIPQGNNNSSEKGLIYETIADFLIKIGYCDFFPNSKFRHLTGNCNNAKLKIMNVNKYLNKKALHLFYGRIYFSFE